MIPTITALQFYLNVTYFFSNVLEPVVTQWPNQGEEEKTGVLKILLIGSMRRGLITYTQMTFRQH